MILKAGKAGCCRQYPEGKVLLIFVQALLLLTLRAMSKHEKKKLNSLILSLCYSLEVEKRKGLEDTYQGSLDTG